MIDWSKSHCGVMLCSFSQTAKLMPEVFPMLESLMLSGAANSSYLIDVKVHMLMPGQYPCIPNWHEDFVPRPTGKGVKDFSKISLEPMFLWVSGEPETEWKHPEDIEYIESGGYRWAKFTQEDSHRGTKSTIHTWRCFIRAIPAAFPHEGMPRGIIRRHSQVYLDAQTFTW